MNYRTTTARLIASTALASVSSTAWAVDPTEARRNDHEAVEPSPPPPTSGFSFLGVTQMRTVLTNVVTTNPLLDGQIVGQLGGTNSTTTRGPNGGGEGEGGPLAWYSEQRVNGFFSYRPPVVDGRIGLTAAFEVDFGFGDDSYGNRGNAGGGFGADQVNLQTRRLHLDVRALDKPKHTIDVRLGLQFVSDGVRDPATARRDDLFRTGGGLRFFGSEASGVTVFGTVRGDAGVRARYKVGAYTLWEFRAGEVDDVTLFQADAELNPGWSTRVGVHGWYLNDSSGGATGNLGRGPTSQLSELQGGPKLAFTDGEGGPAAEVNADVGWVGVDGGLNHDLGKGRLGLNGALFANLGRITVPQRGWVAIGGLMANAELRYRYAPGRGSVIRVEGLFTSADNPATDSYDGVLTANSWGVVGAVYGSHGTYLLFPDITAINRQSAVVYDVSNAGSGLIGVNGGVAWDAIPNRLNLAVTGAVASDARRELVGSEVNLRVEGEPLPFLKLGLTGALAFTPRVPVAPFALFADLEWVAF